MDKAEFRTRFKAAVMDLGLIVAVCVLFDLAYRFFLKPPGTVTFPAPGDLAAFLAALAVYALFEGLAGQSPGKMATHIVVRTSDGRPAEIFTLLLRSFLKNSMFLVPLIIMGAVIFMHAPTPAFIARYTGTLVGMIMVQLVIFIALALGVAIFNGCFLVLTQNRQTLHDKLTDTAVYPGGNTGPKGA